MAMDKTPAGETWENFNQTISSELEHSKRAYKEVALMLEQSQAELVKMTQRSASISAHSSKFRHNLISISTRRHPHGLQLDAGCSQRLLVMRGQIEKIAERPG
jgi:two-component system sensor histidine kinase DegS